jgi:hypothetical protein
MLPPRRPYSSILKMYQKFMKITDFWHVTPCGFLYGINVSEEHIASIFKVNLEEVGSRFLPKRLWLSARLHVITFQKIAIFLVSSVRTSDITYEKLTVAVNRNSTSTHYILIFKRLA